MDNKTLFTHPILRTVLIFGGLWLITTVLVIAVITNMFVEPIIQPKYFVLYMLLFASTSTMVTLIKNYIKTRK
ncbi:MAG TPA: hypothetical protein PK218_08605 [Flavobacterium sp.]|jgi:hypothetical protein|uniref:hypothetical protein n=1 Tax=Flavobacterium sp. TaxID=239 RepID=UPI002C895C28|nr:hypothetical protein [Bacteroidota bacterium]HPW98607.1 hypothetical protein [Flavobacterium sp.]